MNVRMKAGLHLTFPPSESSPLSFLLQVALETLIHGGPQKPPTHPLADYHYAGTGARLREWVCPATTREPVGLGAGSACAPGRAPGALLLLPFQKGLSSPRDLSGCLSLLAGSSLPPSSTVVPSGAVPSQEGDPLARER